MKGFYYILTICLITLSSLKSFGQSNNLPSEVEILFNEQQFEKIVDKASLIRAYSKDHADSTSAELLYFLGDAYLALDQMDEGLLVMEEELEIRYQMDQVDSLMIADICFNLGYYYTLTDDFGKSINYYERASKLYKSVEGESSQSYLDSKIEIIRTLSLNQESNKALKLAKEIEKKSFLTPNYELLIKKEIGLIYLDLGNYYLADKLLSEYIIQIERKSGRQNLQYIEALLASAAVNFYTSSYAKAEEFYSKALKLAAKIDGTDHLIDLAKNNLALVYWRIGLYEEAKQLFKEIISQDKTLENAITSKNLAQVLILTQEFKEAKVYFDLAFNVIQEVYENDTELKAQFLKERALLYLAQNDFKPFMSEMESSYNIASKVLNKQNPEYSKYEFQLGKAFYRVNQINEAKNHINKAYTIRKKHLARTHPLYAEATRELAELNWYEQNSKAAQAFYQETFDNYFTQIEAYFPALSEQEKANFYSNTLRPTFEEYNSFVINNYKEQPELLSDMYNYQLATKGLIMYATEKARDQIFNSGDSALIESYENWISTKEQIARLYSLTAEEIEEDPLNLDSLQKQSNALEKQLSRKSAEFSEAYDNKKLVWQDIQKELKEGEAAIEMIRFRKFIPDSSGQFTDKVFYAALLINKQLKTPELILFENGAELESKYIKNYKNAIKYKVQDKYSYSQYWKPIAAKTDKYNLIYLSPDGIYNQISINSLYNNETKKYVLEEQNIQLLTNTKDLIALRNTDNSKYADAGKSALFGFPNYNKGLSNENETQQVKASEIADNVSLDRGLRGSLSRYIRGNSLVTALPGTKEEVEKIDKLYKELTQDTPKMNLANEADELAVKQVENPKVLHIATHGFFLEDAESEVESADDKYAQNPLLKSGMILAGANSFITSGVDEETGQDGILTAYEAMNLNLNATELVILSACETGLGDLKNGEGVYGLRRAFFVAGADAIIMSLWSVDDGATQELMTEFYKHWLAGKTKQEAFLMAQNFTKEKYKDPFYWGAFVMVGE